MKNNETLLHALRHSCLGRLIIAAAVLAVLAVIACLTRPGEEKMRLEIDDDIRQCLEERDSVTADWTETFVKNIRYMFTKADSVLTHPEDLQVFYEFNSLAFYDNMLFTTMHVHNSFYIEGKRCAIGIFGLIIPVVDFNDFLLREGPMFKEYERPKPSYDADSEEFFGDNPDLGGVFEYNGD